jgi:predicted nucleotidyltransferase
MEAHHEKGIEEFLARYAKDQKIKGILLTGSLVHGYAKTDSDIDIFLIVAKDEYLKRKAANTLAFSLWDICTYENGYIDCKVIDLDFLKSVAQSGSDPARYAFKDSKILYSKLDGLQELLDKIASYPSHQKDERNRRFAAQILAWKWYYSEGVKKENKYLVYLAIQKLILFASRIVLNENQQLYPFHKWMLREVESAKNKPADIMQKIDNLLNNHSLESINVFCDYILNFIGFTEKTVDWPNYFLKDSEQNWLFHEPPIDDI